jgi:hypothetical protein
MEVFAGDTFNLPVTEMKERTYYHPRENNLKVTEGLFVDHEKKIVIWTQATLSNLWVSHKFNITNVRTIMEQLKIVSGTTDEADGSEYKVYFICGIPKSQVSPKGLCFQMKNKEIRALASAHEKEEVKSTFLTKAESYADTASISLTLDEWKQLEPRYASKIIPYIVRIDLGKQPAFKITGKKTNEPKEDKDIKQSKSKYINYKTKQKQ